MDNFLGEIRIVSFNFAPNDWALCNGQLLAISQYTALFSLLGTFYGGDGRTTFQLPNLQGCAALDQGQGPTLSERIIGDTGGEATHTLILEELPSHAHLMSASSVPGTTNAPQGAVYAVPVKGGTPENLYAPTPNATGAASEIYPTGGGQSHDNMQPTLVMNFIIALTGIYPSRG